MKFKPQLQMTITLKKKKMYDFVLDSETLKNIKNATYNNKYLFNNGFNEYLGYTNKKGQITIYIILKTQSFIQVQ